MSAKRIDYHGLLVGLIEGKGYVQLAREMGLAKSTIQSHVSQPCRIWMAADPTHLRYKLREVLG